MAEIPEPKPAADTVPLDQEAKDLKLAQTKAEARKGIAEAEAATLKAQLPAVTATGLEGSIEAKDKFGTLAEVVGYAALGDAAAEIARRVNDAIKGPGSPRVLLVEQTDIASTDAVLLQIKPVLDWHEADISARIGALETLGKPREAPADDSDTLREMLSITSALAVGGAVIGAVSQIASLIRTNYVATGREFKADNLALMAEVARRLKELQVSAVIEGFDLITASPLFARFAALQKQRAHLDAQRRRVNEVVIAPAVATTTDLAKRIGDTELEVARRKDDDKPAGELEKQIKTWKGAQAELALRLDVARAEVAQADATASAWDALAKDLTTAAATGGRTPLLQAALREAIHGAKITHLLCLKTVSSGGDVITERRWLRSARASFIGSATAVFLLSGVGEAGALAASGTVSAANRLVYNLGNGGTDGIGQISLTPENG